MLRDGAPTTSLVESQKSSSLDANFSRPAGLNPNTNISDPVKPSISAISHAESSMRHLSVVPIRQRSWSIWAISKGALSSLPALRFWMLHSSTYRGQSFVVQGSARKSHHDLGPSEIKFLKVTF